MSTKLTPKQKRFVEEYMVDMNGTQAAIRAGYSEKNAKHSANENFARPHIADLIKKKQEEMSERTGLTAEWVVEKLRENIDRAMQHTPVLNSKGEETGEYKYDGAVVNKSLELLGKHIGMFVERKHVTGEVTVKRVILDEANRKPNRLIEYMSNN